MRGGHHEVARAYVLYRERRAQERANQVQQQAPAAPRCMFWKMASVLPWTRVACSR